jgi:hypothetical protein
MFPDTYRHFLLTHKFLLTSALISPTDPPHSHPSFILTLEIPSTLSALPALEPVR